MRLDWIRRRSLEISAFVGLLVAAGVGAFAVLFTLGSGPCGGDGGSMYSEPGSAGDRYCSYGGMVVLAGAPALLVVLGYFWYRGRDNAAARIWLFVAAGLLVTLGVYRWSQGLSTTA